MLEEKMLLMIRALENIINETQWQAEDLLESKSFINRIIKRIYYRH